MKLHQLTVHFAAVKPRWHQIIDWGLAGTQQHHATAPQQAECRPSNIIAGSSIVENLQAGSTSSTQQEGLRTHATRHTHTHTHPGRMVAAAAATADTRAGKGLLTAHTMKIETRCTKVLLTIRCKHKVQNLPRPHFPTYTYCAGVHASPALQSVLLDNPQLQKLLMVLLPWC